ncbi:unnamed protein product [Allacma fusca]|uniref:Peptidase S1 domain-containing protein n=1 Tax=Allacma fusca TaxID=39272 RepID=A0A8J2NJ88_9HEXA|nr:unnamed protein product [Allacma fusca]
MFLSNTLVFNFLFLYVASLPVEDISGGERIHKGDKPKEDYPSIVSIIAYVSETQGKYCGGTVITEKHLLTAAHCFSPNVKKYAAILGSRHNTFAIGRGSQEITFGPEAWTLNPGYEGNKTGYIFDTAVITLPKTIKLSNKIQTIRLAKKVYTNNVRVVGWGKNDCNGNSIDETYLYAKGWIVDDDTCAKEYKEPTHASQICAKFKNEKGELSGQDSMDSGGPLYATADDGEDVEIGTVSQSWKINYKTPQECTKVEIPQKHGKISEAETFIKSVAPDAVFV